ncbi:DUF397 domain-containing protein [Streptomyces caatingaensis]|uniref:DUF397 domain-containing protein n=1 Tax=Streptomyces caatingaensis TaxID=1678637 RepID=UPI00099B5F14|nr:DUF397 domain-containing protein [Streptomyces caatingaensis]
MNGVSWVKSSYTGENGSNCVEVADLADRVGIRDSKNPSLRSISVPNPAWKALVAELGAQ